ncbi:MAG: hypothetical protein HUK12_00020 [Muribaculaceae bacterium]|nr:hypothetical protein [Muribaculaceae bacterium]
MNAVYSYSFVRGADYDKGREDLNNLIESKKSKRRYLLEHPIYMVAECDTGRLLARSEAGFMFDGRSGPPLIDCIVPNLGTEDERAGWLFHDLLAYGDSLNFRDTNRFLRLFLRDQAGYSKFTAWLIETAVGIDDSWYGPPSKDDWCRCNIGKVTTIWIPK